ncbi:cupin domain-containing protein [Novosphingobium mathurense]|uniref:Cupin domain-containing protein n=1 Tax=Novosphingobium mathurense TaxID=428990 RepID=A0A1U6HFI4_9SPHN|nr:cupin domain-containing protein [Novosphingobium mathurense]SLJ94518.1 Cupin domain-containing protein [Novosphingobium mathurense]
MSQAHNLHANPIHLGLGARAEAQPAFTGLEWYEAYAARTLADGAEGRLVALHDFSGDWTSWEVHPEGDEVVVCTAGEMTLIQEREDGSTTSQVLAAGEYAINPAGTWHTADIARTATALFITCGFGTLHRPR